MSLGQASEAGQAKVRAMHEAERLEREKNNPTPPEPIKEPEPIPEIPGLDQPPAQVSELNEADPRVAALEVMPDAELQAYAATKLPKVDKRWSRATLIKNLLAIQ